MHIAGKTTHASYHFLYGHAIYPDAILFALVKVETFVTLTGNYCSQPKVDKLYRAASWMQK